MSQLKRKWPKIVITIFLSLLLVLMLIPIAWSLSMAFDRSVTTFIPNPPRLLPEEPSFFNFSYAMETTPLWRLFGNTLFVTAVNTVISVFFAICTGYAFAKGKFFLKKFWFVFMLTVMMIPFESRMLTLYLQYVGWGMANTYWPLVLGNFAYVYGMFMARNNIMHLPDSLREAAFIDGASEWRTFFVIIVPLCGPIIATLSILQVISNWNSFLWPLIVISKREKYLLSVGVALFNASEGAMYFGPRMAVAVISSVPLIIMFAFLQKYIVASIALSGIKQ